MTDLPDVDALEGGRGGVPLVLTVLWLVWLGLAVVSLVAWLAVSFLYPVPFWPMALALPGLLLALATAATMYVRTTLL